MKKYATELFLFSFSLAVAYFMGWNNTDLIWSFWITSLVVGYVTIFRTTVAPLRLLTKLIRNPEDTKKFREMPTVTKLKISVFILFFIPMSLFYVVFLSLHFCIFHVLLAYWLHGLMPHPGINDILTEANSGGFYVSFQIVKVLLISYWTIVLQKLIFDYRTNWERGSNKVTNVKQEFFSFDSLKRPYVQVVRIIALMVILFLLHAIEVNQYLIYVVIYSLFYFPMPAFGKHKTVHAATHKPNNDEQKDS
ncbi:MAG: DUF6498-containing protein [Bacteroidota bacterium]|nr:DUF6498-containing protein [Bacteroidota bacterium]